MAVIKDRSIQVADAIESALKGMGDLSGASVTIIDHMTGEGNGNMPSAQLMEIFAPVAGYAKKEVVIVTNNLGFDDIEQQKLVGADGKGLLNQKFSSVAMTGLRFDTYPMLAARMIEESTLGPHQQEGLRHIVQDDMKKGAFDRSSGAETSAM